MSSPRLKLTISINERRCLGCGGCMDTAPSMFRLGRQFSAYIGPSEADAEDRALIREAEMFCPARAITVFTARIRE